MTEQNQDLTDDYEWGGDGSDLNQPVRAHVEAALVPSSGPYPPPLDKLLSFGSPNLEEPDPQRFNQLGITQQHMPDLVRMARDRGLNTAPWDSPEVWAPIHALDALKQLDVRDAVADLLPLLDVESDWIGEELPELLGAAGEPALEPVQRYLNDRSRWLYGRAGAGTALVELVKHHEELRDRAVAILVDELAGAENNDSALNGFLIGDLIHLRAVDALPTIRAAFETNNVDESIVGDWAEVAGELGQVLDPDDPLVERSRRRWDAQLAQRQAIAAARSTPRPPRKPSASTKQKNKRKASKAARKRNKRK